MKHSTRFAGNSSDVARRKDRAAGRRQTHAASTDVDDESPEERAFREDQEQLDVESTWLRDGAREVPVASSPVRLTRPLL